MRWVCIVKSNDDMKKNASTKLLASALSPPDELIAGNGTASAAWVLASRRGGGEGRQGDGWEGDKRTKLIVQLRSQYFPQTHDIVALMACNLMKKYGTYIM